MRATARTRAQKLAMFQRNLRVGAVNELGRNYSEQSAQAVTVIVLPLPSAAIPTTPVTLHVVVEVGKEAVR